MLLQVPLRLVRRHARRALEAARQAEVGGGRRRGGDRWRWEVGAGSGVWVAGQAVLRGRMMPAEGGAYCGAEPCHARGGRAEAGVGMRAWGRT